MRYAVIFIVAIGVSMASAMTKTERRLYQEIARLRAGLAEIRDRTNPAPAWQIARDVLNADKISVPGSVDQSGD